MENGRNGKKKEPVLVIIQLSGGNDFMNTLIPFTNGIYHDSRPLVGIAEDEALPINGELAFHPSASVLRDLYSEGNVAIVQGIGYENSSRSHFRSMDIWHTCEPNEIATEGWLAKVIREIDPEGKNPLTGVSFGRGLPRAMAAPGVTATSVGNLDNYGLMTGIEIHQERERRLETFKRVYTPAVGSGVVMDYLGQTGHDVLRGADLISVAPQRYTFDRRVRRQPDSPGAEGRRQGAYGRPRYTHLLHAARWLRSPRAGIARTRQAACRTVNRYRRLPDRPPRARCSRRGGHPRVHRIRPQDSGQRQRHRPRLWRRRIHRW